MTAPVLETFATTAPGGAGATVTCDAPANIQVGDLLVALVSGAFASGDPTVSLSGWSHAVGFSFGGAHLAILSKTATSEPASYEFNLGISLSSRRVAILRISGAGGLNVTPSQNSGSSTTATGMSVTTTEDDCLALLGVRWGANSDSFSPSNSSVLAINRLGVGQNIQSSAGATGNITAAIANGAWLASVVAIEPLTGPINQPPTVALNTLDGAEIPEGGYIEFTGTDGEADGIRYQIEIADTPEFSSGVNVTAQLTSGAGTIIHPNPVGGMTWEGHRQIDDRIGFGFVAKGGRLVSADFFFGPHETWPENTDGDYLARLYATAGYSVDPVPPAWAAATPYSEGAIVRPTSTANANVHFVYRCKVAGTSGGSEPAWPGNGVNWLTVSPGAEVSDGGVTWEALPGLHPLDAADEADTPTPGWIAQSEIYPYAPGVADSGWKTLAFTGENGVRLVHGTLYMIMLDWRPANHENTNTLAVQNASLANAVAAGNTYLDGVGSNNGPRIIDDPWHRVREESETTGATSGTDSGFSNADTPADTDPFNSSDKIRFALPAGLAIGHLYYYRVRVSDPGGSTAWSDWSETRSFVVTSEPVARRLAAVALAQSVADASLAVIRGLAVEGLAQSATGEPQLLVMAAIRIETAMSSQSATWASIAVTRVLSVSSAGQSETAARLTVARSLTAQGNAHSEAIASLAIIRRLAAEEMAQSATSEPELLLTAVLRLAVTMLASSETGSGLLAVSRLLAAVGGGQSATSAPALGLMAVINLAAALLAQSETADARLMVAHSLAAQIETEGETAVSRLVVARSPVVALSAQSETEEQSLAVARLLATALLATSASNQPALVLADIVGLVHAVFSSARPGASFSSRRN